MGIRGMEERARSLGGSFSCRTLGGQGSAWRLFFRRLNNIILQSKNGNLRPVLESCDRKYASNSCFL
jgi:hypothetical protein